MVSSNIWILIVIVFIWIFEKKKIYHTKTSKSSTNDRKTINTRRVCSWRYMCTCVRINIYYFFLRQWRQRLYGKYLCVFFAPLWHRLLLRHNNNMNHPRMLGIGIGRCVCVCVLLLLFSHFVSSSYANIIKYDTPELIRWWYVCHHIEPMPMCQWYDTHEYEYDIYICSYFISITNFADRITIIKIYNPIWLHRKIELNICVYHYHCYILYSMRIVMNSWLVVLLDSFFGSLIHYYSMVHR